MASRGSSFDGPKPGDGIADWASKIREIQRQVDADEQAEERRLADEIAASRLKRLSRRSQLTGSKTDSLDLSKSSELTSLIEMDNKPSNDGPKSPTERQTSQAEALAKLSGRAPAPSGLPDKMASASSMLSQKPRAEPMSLAAFMGGRATGPRLNRHMPQQDAHDPTQFEARSVAQIQSAPHPVFGRGGMPLPGMSPAVAKATSVPSSTKNEELTGSSPPEATKLMQSRAFSAQPVSTYSSPSPKPVQPPIASPKPAWEKPAVSPQPVSSYSSPPLKPVQPPVVSSKPAVSPQPVSSYSSPPSKPVQPPILSPKPAWEKPAVSPQSRPSTQTSSPSDTIPTKQALALPSTGGAKSSWEEQRNNSPAFPRQTSSPRPVSRTPEPVTTAKQPPSINTPPSPTTRRSFTSPGPTPGSPSSPSFKVGVSTQSLAKPLPPQNPTSSGPRISVSKSPSPAFQRAAPPKDLTPSLSRLQGRGFVQNMVKVSAHLDTQSSSAPASESLRPGSGGRKQSVLDRWQPVAPAESKPIPTFQTNSPAPRPMRKSWTVDNSATSPTATTPPTQNVLKSVQSEASLKPQPGAVRLPLMAEKVPPTGLGSRTTMMVVRPPSQNDQATPPRQTMGQAPTIDEFGAKVPQASTPSDLPSAGKPLLHPTRDRARPGKSKGRKQQSSSTSSGFAPEESPAPMKAGIPNHQPSAQFIQRAPAELNPSNRVTDRWGENSVIGVKPTGQATKSIVQPTPKPNGMVGKVALPGLSAPAQSQPRSRSVSPSDTRPSPPSTTQSPGIGIGAPPRERSPGAAAKHARIPSTGNRATVMDVAQVMQERAESTSPISPRHPEPTLVAEPEPIPTPEPVQPTPEPAAEPVSSPIARPRAIAPGAAERRRSSYADRYSSLPPLVEETTPVASPANTYSRKAGEVHATISLEDISSKISEPKPSPEDQIVSADLMQVPLPQYNIEYLVSARPAVLGLDPTTSTISVDVLSVSGNSAAVISKDANVFYETETLAIVRRYKSKTSGLVGTTLWAWRGRQADLGVREQQKLTELAKRYGTSVINVSQGSEPNDLVLSLDATLSIRQGTREHWSAENTAMHSIRETSTGVVIIDEFDLHIKNLCSGYSFCLSLLGTQYVWHGVGSKPSERKAAVQFAERLASNPSEVLELVEGESDDDETFWMMLGDESFGKADHWRWRAGESSASPRIFTIDIKNSKSPLSLVEEPSWSPSPSGLYILDCVWETIVLVGQDARSDRTGIRLAIAAANDLSTQLAPTRPFAPPVHVLALPSQLPLDLRLVFRNLDESSLNNGEIPEHMNLLPGRDALLLLARRAWDSPIWATETKHFI
ncbi:hypothetical protein DL96DRAFT_1603512 [Flagelloscypha sp. PMI_526]|nr:hypothetical protein DL96DRAFT_1603512 [Flagelloscypha sp. PMI_526]